MQELPNIFLIGPMGTGKSTIGRLLAAELRRVFYDSDHEIERRCGCNIPWIFDVEGESGFRDRETRTIDRLTRHRGVVMATGGGAIIREANRRMLQERGTVIYLHASLEQLVKRTSRDRNRPLLQCEDPAARLRELMAQRESLYLETADLIVSTERRSPRSVINTIKRDVRQLMDPLNHEP
ncbi:shikimate kinase AroK [Larsenimonas rhizosphaerae]|uniref:Shikimate kinase n=1 Tax=Larsenimonas rhizosphaerae TaxID=2944682 RepID=A0AA41ZGS5_9GAMM|nr:shikimate kinase AroK [Larsenimonas rhizosphaerae]MCM2129712.1 shikimate kinase AroK [Larsenimonas rhizosphaerae]MCX2524371.1 shikimate kinase AroK [Larsenimonas rhizosphaerae]